MAQRKRAPAKFRNKWYIGSKKNGEVIMVNANKQSRHRYKVLDVVGGVMKYFRRNQVATRKNNRGRVEFKYGKVASEIHFVKPKSMREYYRRKVRVQRKYNNKKRKARRA